MLFLYTPRRFPPRVIDRAMMVHVRTQDHALGECIQTNPAIDHHHPRSAHDRTRQPTSARANPTSWLHEIDPNEPGARYPSPALGARTNPSRRAITMSPRKPRVVDRLAVHVRTPIAIPRPPARPRAHERTQAMTWSRRTERTQGHSQTCPTVEARANPSRDADAARGTNPRRTSRGPGRVTLARTNPSGRHCRGSPAIPRRVPGAAP